MFIEKESYFYIEEFEKYGITAVYTKKIAGNMSGYLLFDFQLGSNQTYFQQFFLYKPL